jgi:hypothetical protein
MKDLYLTITADDWEIARRALFTPDDNENAGVLLCGHSETTDARRLLVRRFVPVPADQYIKRQAYHLEISPAFYNEIVTRCLRDGLSPVIIHSHPHHGEAWYSASDDVGEQRLLDTLAALLPQAWSASLVVTLDAVAGRELRDHTFVGITGITIAGVRSAIYRFDTQADSPSFEERFDRQIRAFGEDGQTLIERLKVAVVGVGGIGSLVAEQLVRAGIRDLRLIDDDRVEESNVSRLFGATSDDNGKAKAEVISTYLNRIATSATTPFVGSAIRQTVLKELRDRDIVFLCVDNDRTRAILNRFAHQYLIPVIDHGSRLDAREGTITAAAGRVTVVGSGLACLRCSHHLNAERIRAESMSASERLTLQREGYIMGIDEPAPAVVTINSVVAGLGATAGLNLFVGLTGAPQPVDQIYDATSGAVFPVSPRHDGGCDVCDTDAGAKAIGDAEVVSAYD